MIGTVTQLQCRSYASLEFDGCPACTDAALDATQQAALYVLGRAALELPARGGSIEMATTMSIRILDEQGRTIAQDQIDAEQTIRAVETDEQDEENDESDADDEASRRDHFSGMRLEDFQTVLDRLELSPMGSGMCGRMGGQLYGFERSIGRFEVEVAPAR